MADSRATAVDAAGLRALAAETSSRRVRGALEELSRRVAAGEPLAAAVSGPQAGIPTTLAAVIRAGQRCGRLPGALSGYLDLLREERDLRQSLWAGLAYPIILMFCSLVIVVSVACIIMPSFDAMFADFGVELPDITRYTLTVASILRNFGWWLLLGAVLIIVALWGVVRVVLPAEIRSQLVDLLPVVGSARQNLALARFCRLLALLVGGETPLPEALRLAGSGSNAGLSAAADVLANHIEAGAAPGEAVLRLPQFPRWLAPLLRWHDRGPAFVEALDSAADLCIARSRSELTLITLIAEPAVIVLVALTVGFSIVSVFMPLMKLLNELS